MRTSIVIIFTLFSIMNLDAQCDSPGNNVAIDPQGVNIDPFPVTPTPVGGTGLIVIQVNNESASSAYIPANEAVITIGFPQSIIMPLNGTITLVDQGGVYNASNWYVSFDNQANGAIQLKNSTNWPVDQSTILSWTYEAIAVGGTPLDLNLNLNISPEAASSNCSDINPNNNSVTGTLYTVESPSPVEMLSFTVEAEGFDAKLRWSTASETDNDRFEIERSEDGLRYEKIGEVEGTGTTTKNINYSYTDKRIGSQLKGKVYYRLHQVDYDGSWENSIVRYVEFGRGDEMKIYPNPTTGRITIEIPIGEGNIKIYNTVGLLVKEQMYHLGEEIELTDLPKGVYRVIAENAIGEEIGSEKIVKIK